MLLAFCGVDGSGKTEYQNILNDFLISKGINTICIDPMQNGNMITCLKNFVDENNLSSIYEYFPAPVVSGCYALDMLFHMNKYSHINNGSIILSHRYDICCKVYGMINEIDMSVIDNLCKRLPKPDIIIFLDVNPENALQRIKERAGKKSWKEEIAVIEKASFIYKKLINEIPENQVLVLDNNISKEKKHFNINIIIKRINEIANTNLEYYKG